ncbi:MAG: hypothetical protein WEA24_14630 [Gemmatimonadota bacterium]
MAMDEHRDDREELLDTLERRALDAMPEDEPDPADEAAPVDVLGALSQGTGEPGQPDVTLGGYIQMHDRVPAFDGPDGQPYTVAVDVADSGREDRPHAGFLMFIRWAATGAGIMDHAESGDLAYAATEEAARAAVLDLSLYEVKAELDAAVARREREREREGVDADVS